MRGHPFIRVPRVYTDLSTRRVLVSEYVEGERFEEVRRAERQQRDRYGEIVFRFFFGLLYRDRIALGDPHPGNYLLRAGRPRLLPRLRPAPRRRRRPRRSASGRSRSPSATGTRPA